MHIWTHQEIVYSHNCTTECRLLQKTIQIKHWPIQARRSFLAASSCLLYEVLTAPWELALLSPLDEVKQEMQMTNKREIWKYTEFSLGMVHVSSILVDAGES